MSTILTYSRLERGVLENGTNTKGIKIDPLKRAVAARVENPLEWDVAFFRTCIIRNALKTLAEYSASLPNLSLFNWHVPCTPTRVFKNGEEAFVYYIAYPDRYIETLSFVWDRVRKDITLAVMVLRDIDCFAVIDLEETEKFYVLRWCVNLGDCCNVMYLHK